MADNGHIFEVLYASANGGGPPVTVSWCADCGTLRKQRTADPQHTAEYRMGGGDWTTAPQQCPGSTVLAVNGAAYRPPSPESAGVTATRLFNCLRALWEQQTPFSPRAAALYGLTATADLLRDRVVTDELRHR